MKLPNVFQPTMADDIKVRKQIDLMETISPLSIDTKNHLEAILQPVFYKRKDSILNYNEVCNYALFLIDGLVKSTFIVEDQERIVWFVRQGEVVIAVHSWYAQEASEERLTAVKDCTCLAMSRSHYESLLSAHPDFVMFTLRMTERYYNFAIQRTKWVQFNTAERLKAFEQLFPNLYQEIPLTDLAKFLGISRETLTRIRRQQSGR